MSYMRDTLEDLADKYGSRIDPARLLAELESRGLSRSDFIDYMRSTRDSVIDGRVRRHLKGAYEQLEVNCRPGYLRQ